MSISYTCVKLDQQSKDNLFIRFNSLIPEGWVWIGTHMTIKLGELSDEQRDTLLGTTQTLKVTRIGKSDMAIAVEVTGCHSDNKIPHITLAINKNAGAKPVMSNYIENWMEIVTGEPLTGIVTEVPNVEQKTDAMNEIVDIKTLPFIDDIKSAGGKIYQVGGAVRDTYLNKVSKDLDIVITGIPSDKLQTILSKYGKTDMVGASFGIIKFTPKNGEEIDIAIPRTERKIGAGYQGFDVNADHTLPIEKDLERRDFTMNSIAKDMDGNIIDPYNGVVDIKNKLIRLTNPAAFSEDPLRMLRAIQFASRFGFSIEPDTFDMIVKNAHKIKEITPERVLIEFQKIVDKGKPIIAAQLLVKTALFDEIFDNIFIGSLKPFVFVKKLSEFVYWLIQGFTASPSSYFKDVLKGDIKTTAEIKALELVMSKPVRTDLESKWMVFQVNKIAPSMLTSHFIMSELRDVIFDFQPKSKNYPISYKELAINGTDVESLGFKKEKVGLALKTAMDGIYSDLVPNDKSMLLNFVNSKMNEKIVVNKETIVEMVQKEETVYFFDFDGTLMNSPLPDAGKDYWSKVKGVKYPHKGWWSKEESLDMNVFDIQPKGQVETIYREVMTNPKDHAVLLTNRQFFLADQIEAVLDKHNMKFEFYSYKQDADEKGDRILKIMTTHYPNVKNIVFLDDDQKHLDNAEMVLAGKGYNLKTIKISSDLDYKTQDNEPTN